MSENIIKQLYNEFSIHGFISEDRIFEVLESNNISLFDSDNIIDALLSRGVIIRDVATKIADNENTEYDKGHYDYEEIYNAIIEVEPGLKILVDYVRTIQPPQHREWQSLLPQAQNGNAFARNRLFEMYMRSVLRIAYQFSQKYSQPLSDTIQNGLIGLFLSIDKFEFGRQDNFPQYYPLWVIQQIKREAEPIKSTIHYPAYTKEQMFAIYEIIKNHLCEECVAPYNCTKLLTEVCHILDCSVDNALEIIKSMETFESYEYYFFNKSGDINEEHDSIDENFNLWEIIDKNSISTNICFALSKINPRGAQIIRIRYGFIDGRVYTLEEVGKMFGITRERVRQIEIKSLRELRQPKFSKYLK